MENSINKESFLILQKDEPKKKKKNGRTKKKSPIR